MSSAMLNNLIALIVKGGLIAIVFYSIIIHEISHGISAYWLGDDTARRNGRLSLNPLKHIDWFGTVILPLVLYFTAGFVFGYAKPVPINPYNFNNMKRDTGLTAAAGPLSNILIAILFALVYHLVGSGSVLGYLCIPLIQINLFLALFNLIPIPPLDGSKVLGIFLSDEAYFKYTAQERNGMIVFFALILVSNMFHLDLFGRFITPVISFACNLLGIPA
jgi:Zn-dependent protease